MTVLGTLDLRAWDTGCMLTLGASTVQYVVDGDSRGILAVDVPGVDSGIDIVSGKVPCFFNTPEDSNQNYILPSYVFKRNDMTVAFDRAPWYAWVGRAPAAGAKEVILPDGTKGWDRYEEQWRGTPFDISYDLMIYARREQESSNMLTYALRRMIPPWFVFKVIDSIGDVRQYDAGDMTISNISELADIADRMIGWSIAFTVRAEIDLHDSMEFPAMTERRFVYSRM